MKNFLITILAAGIAFSINTSQLNTSTTHSNDISSVNAKVVFTLNADTAGGEGSGVCSFWDRLLNGCKKH